MKHVKKFKLFMTFEAAENFYDMDGEYVTVGEYDSIPFVWEWDNPGNIIFGEESSYHDDNVEIEDFDPPNGTKRGRIWTEHKVMGFWNTPTDEEFPELIKVLEDELGLKIFNNGWYYDEGDELESVDKYDASKVVVDEEAYKLHMMSPTEREQYYKANPDKRKKPKGFGSDFYSGKLPKGMTPVQYKNKKTKFQYTESRVMTFETYNTHVVADSTTMNNVPVTQYVDLDYFGTNVEMDEKEPPNPTGRDDREVKNKTKKAVAKISVV